MSDLKALQQKASDFFDQFFERHQEHMKCSAGCDQCCYVDLSVMGWEAALIEDWFYSLPEKKQIEIKKLWTHSSAEEKYVFGAKQSPCSFLDQHSKCSIYPARPTICRTQGMSMQWYEGEERMRSWCELNFTDIDPSSIPPLAEDLNLDTINTMVAHAQILWSKNQGANEQDSRVSLKDLQKSLLNN